MKKNVSSVEPVNSSKALPDVINLLNRIIRLVDSPSSSPSFHLNGVFYVIHAVSYDLFSGDPLLYCIAFNEEDGSPLFRQSVNMMQLYMSQDLYSQVCDGISSSETDNFKPLIL